MEDAAVGPSRLGQGRRKPCNPCDPGFNPTLHRASSPRQEKRQKGRGLEFHRPLSTAPSPCCQADGERSSSLLPPAVAPSGPEGPEPQPGPQPDIQAKRARREPTHPGEPARGSPWYGLRQAQPTRARRSLGQTECEGPGQPVGTCPQWPGCFSLSLPPRAPPLNRDRPPPTDLQGSTAITQRPSPDQLSDSPSPDNLFVLSLALLLFSSLRRRAPWHSSEHLSPEGIAEAQRASIAKEAHRKRSECHPHTVLLVLQPALRLCS